MRRMTAVTAASPGTCPASTRPQRSSPLGLATFRQQWRPPFIYSEAVVLARWPSVPAGRPDAPSGSDVPDDDRAVGRYWHARGRSHRTCAIRHRPCGEGVVIVMGLEVQQEPRTRRSPRLDGRGRLGAYARLPDRCRTTAVQPPTFFEVPQGHGGDLRRLLGEVPLSWCASPVLEPALVPPAHSRSETLLRVANTLIRWYRAGEDVWALLPQAATYLGHLAELHVLDLSAVPEPAARWRRFPGEEVPVSLIGGDRPGNCSSADRIKQRQASPATVRSYHQRFRSLAAVRARAHR